MTSKVLLSLMTSIVLSLFACCSGRCSSRVGPSLVGFIVDDKILGVSVVKTAGDEWWTVVVARAAGGGVRWCGGGAAARRRRRPRRGSAAKL
jgi:hypothetical protein